MTPRAARGIPVAVFSAILAGWSLINGRLIGLFWGALAAVLAVIAVSSWLRQRGSQRE
jgi:hypothetical protein